MDGFSLHFEALPTAGEQFRVQRTVAQKLLVTRNSVLQKQFLQKCKKIDEEESKALQRITGEQYLVRYEMSQLQKEADYRNSVECCNNERRQSVSSVATQAQAKSVSGPQPEVQVFYLRKKNKLRPSRSHADLTQLSPAVAAARRELRNPLHSDKNALWLPQKEASPRPVDQSGVKRREKESKVEMMTIKDDSDSDDDRPSANPAYIRKVIEYLRRNKFDEPLTMDDDEKLPPIGAVASAPSKVRKTGWTAQSEHETDHPSTRQPNTQQTANRVQFTEEQPGPCDNKPVTAATSASIPRVNRYERFSQVYLDERDQPRRVTVYQRSLTARHVYQEASRVETQVREYLSESSRSKNQSSTPAQSTAPHPAHAAERRSHEQPDEQAEPVLSDAMKEQIRTEVEQSLLRQERGGGPPKNTLWRLFKRNPQLKINYQVEQYTLRLLHSA